ncbi:MAG TPA: SDR family oxidoreductase [Miltoncostaeaceae bacterium]|nr:SDR family oxidoreductase [Miltoncostaeaceae bacterium]
MGAALDRFDRVDVMVANAGTAADFGPMPEKLPDDVFAQVVQVNLLGTWYCCKRAGAHMLGRGRGSIVVNASSAGVAGLPNFPSAYQATKAGLINMVRNLAASWADRGVRVNALTPGWFPSEMASPVIDAPGYGERIVQSIPMGRVGTDDEITPALLFLASDASRYVTGINLQVDGGLGCTIGCPPFDDALYALHAAVAPGLGEPIRPEVGAAA